jgi:glucokinase-like ROK family protein
MMKKSTQESTKLHNSRLVLSTIYRLGEISRVEVARQTGLTRTTVSEVVGRFIQEGLVVEAGVSPSRGGKRAILLRVDDDARHLVGIDLANSAFRGAVVNLRGKVVQRVSLPIRDRDGEAALGLAFTLIDQLLQLTDRPILGIGVGTPGLMDPVQRVVRYAANLDWYDLPLGDLLEERYQLPIYIANDSQVAALAEFTFGQHAQVSNLVVIKAGRGVSAGIVLNGELFYGDHHSAGEIGHIRMVPGGERCRCGNTGCLETLVSTRGLLGRARVIAAQQPESQLNRLAASPEEVDGDTVLRAYQAGDPSIQALIAEAGDYLGIAAAQLAGALNVDQVILAGRLARYGEGIIAPMQKRVSRDILPALARHIQVAPSQLGDDVVILGAASLILRHEIGLT